MDEYINKMVQVFAVLFYPSPENLKYVQSMPTFRMQIYMHSVLKQKKKKQLVLIFDRYTLHLLLKRTANILYYICTVMYNYNEITLVIH